MKQKMILIVLVQCLLLSGCSWMDGSKPGFLVRHCLLEFAQAWGY